MKDILEKQIGVEVLENEPMKKYTTFKVGGPAKFFVNVGNKQTLFKAIKAAKENKLDYYVFGGGSNMLVADKGYDGLVIHLDNAAFDLPETGVFRVFAGTNLMSFVQQVIKVGFGGLEFAGNIPGSVGGGTYGNAGAYGKGLGDYVIELETIIVENDEINLKVFTKEECEFAYRESIFKKNKNWIISEIVFRLEKDASADEKMQEVRKDWQKRSCSQPLSLPSAGCSFKNILYTDELSKYSEWEIKGKLPAARFIEEAECKGLKIGGAMVSETHANFIVNFDNATADDIVQVISAVKSRVRNSMGVQLEEEVQYVGF